MENKNKTLHWTITLLLSLVVGAYGYIFNSVIDRVGKLETKVEANNPILLEIQKDLASIKTDITWIKAQQEKATK